MSLITATEVIVSLITATAVTLSPITTNPVSVPDHCHNSHCITINTSSHVQYTVRSHPFWIAPQRAFCRQCIVFSMPDLPLGTCTSNPIPLNGSRLAGIQGVYILSKLQIIVATAGIQRCTAAKGGTPPPTSYMNEA